MKTEKLDFHINSRKPFAEEAPVMAAVEEARKQISQLQGTALFRVTSHLTAEPTVIPRAVDIIRGGMITAVQQAVEKGYAHSVLDEIKKAAGEVSAVGVINGPGKKRSAIHDARNAVSDSLRRLGVTP